jgi:predicted PurR-regulated permease PerM
MFCRSSGRAETLAMTRTARRTLVATLVAVGVVVTALALWKLRLVISLVFIGLIISAAMRPGIEWLRRHRIPRAAGILIHYLVLLGLVALFLWFVVPRAITQVQSALDTSELQSAAQHSTGIKHDILINLQRRLDQLPSAGKLIRPAAQIGVRAFEVLVGIFFTFATAAYWIFERDRAIDLVASLMPRPRRKRMRDTWDLIDLKLGAFVRGQALLVVFVATVLSLIFWAISLPYWLLIGAFAGLVELVPVIGPLAAGALAVGVGLTVSWHTALLAGLAVLGVRLLEDYVVLPKVLGDATGLSPLVVLFSVSAVAILFGGFAVLFAVPLAAVLATVVDVVVRGRDPAEEQVPTVLFPAKDAEG